MVALLVTALLVTAAPAAADPAIVNIDVKTKGSMVTIGAMLIDGFTEDIMEAIDSGIPMTFTYTIELRKISSLWIDSLVNTNVVSNTVQYDSLKKVYRISFSSKNGQSKIVTHDINRLRELMLNLRDVPIASLKKLNPEQRYYVRVKADLETDRFWFPFNYIFFFVPFNDVKTAWAESSPLAWQPTRERAAGPAIRKTPKKKSGNPKVSNHVIRTFN
ncbi:MAG: DUF4390 domain-containing protein [Nitrospinales bacterium]